MHNNLNVEELQTCWKITSNEIILRKYKEPYDEKYTVVIYKEGQLKHVWSIESDDMLRDVQKALSAALLLAEGASCTDAIPKRTGRSETA